MNINTFLFLFVTSIVLFSACTESDMEDPMTNDPNENDPVELNLPCVSEDAAILLPAALQDQNNISQYESTLLISATVALSNNFRTSLSSKLLPPDDAIPVVVDNITILPTDAGYEWTIGDEKFVYLIRDLGYQIYYYEAGDLAGSEMISMEQNEDCSSFDYIQYAIQEDGAKEVGDIEFYFNYQKAGTAKIVSFGADIYDDQNDEYRLRSFEDLSGELTIKNGGTVSQNLNWNADGSGNFQKFENGEIVEEGSWSF